MFFPMFELLFPVFFLFVMGLMAAVVIRGLKEWNHNNHSPRLEVEAQVVTKRVNTTHHHDASNMAMSHTDTVYYVTFQVKSGDRMELHVPGSEYGMLVEGDRGTLSFQGTRYLGFERY